MRVLVACEFSGRVRDSFADCGHDAWSCDLLPSVVGGPHIQGDVLRVLGDGWDLMVAHPPCTHLCSSGARHFHRKGLQQCDAVLFVLELLSAPIAKIALENPVGVLSRRIGKPTQIIQPYQFGDPQRKATCLWLKGLPKLKPTLVVEPRLVKSHSGTVMPEWTVTKKRYGDLSLRSERSVTYLGIAMAMAGQWG